MEHTVWADTQRCSNGCILKGLIHGCDIVRLVLKKKIMLSDREWMKNGARMGVVTWVRSLLWDWEGDGLLNQGDIGGNTKKWTDLENQ